MASDLSVSVDRDKCCGAGHCALLAPDVFDQDEEGLVTLLDSHPGPELADAVRQAAEMCPTWAILISERVPT